jgi:hypothetical protein
MCSARELIAACTDNEHILTGLADLRNIPNDVTLAEWASDAAPIYNVSFQAMAVVYNQCKYVGTRGAAFTTTLQPSRCCLGKGEL